MLSYLEILSIKLKIERKESVILKLGLKVLLNRLSKKEVNKSLISFNIKDRDKWV